jgi:cytochrome c biogenesis protein CcmG/thiol:disulfide interchange protein DsbE
VSRRTIAGISAALIAAIVAAGLFWYHLHPSAELERAAQAPLIGQAKLGETAPSFTIDTTHGPFDLATIRRPVFLEIFATWCPHCQHEAPVIQRLYEHYRDRVAFLAIPGSTTGMDGQSPESAFDVLNFATRFHVTYPIALYDPSLTVANAYLQGGFPTIAIIGRDKRIAYLNSGEVSYDDLARALDAVVNKVPPS